MATREVRAHLLTKRWHGTPDDRKVVTREISREGQMVRVELHRDVPPGSDGMNDAMRAVMVMQGNGDVAFEVWRNGHRVASYESAVDTAVEVTRSYPIASPQTGPKLAKDRPATWSSFESARMFAAVFVKGHPAWLVEEHAESGWFGVKLNPGAEFISELTREALIEEAK